MNSNRIFLSSPTMNGNEMKYIQEAFDTNWIAPLGKNVDEFEKEICDYIAKNSKTVEKVYGAALSSGTAAIHLALKAAGIQKGDLVFCSSLTFSASCNPIIYEGAIPVFIDSELDTWNMDPKALKRAFEFYPTVKAVIVVNLYGVPAKLDEIAKICRENNAVLIEDAAESLGASHKGRQTGTFGEYGVFSFNGNKIITTSGGGMLISSDNTMISKAKFWATQSREKERHYEHKEVGYNYRMSNIVAGIGRGQLITLNEFIDRKKTIYSYYKDNFIDIDDIQMNPYMDESNPNFWLSCITLAQSSKVKPSDIFEVLEKENIESRPIWKPMHLQPIFKQAKCVTVNGLFSCKEKFYTVSEEIYNRGVCLPSDIKNSEKTMHKIVDLVKECFN